MSNLTKALEALGRLFGHFEWYRPEHQDLELIRDALEEANKQSILSSQAKDAALDELRQVKQELDDLKISIKSKATEIPNSEKPTIDPATIKSYLSRPAKKSKS